MKIGISIASSYRVADPREGATNMIERARAAHEAGLDSLFIGDHHVTPEPYYQNSPMLGRLLAEWQNSRPAGALYLLPLWHPVLLAEQIATLASIHPGRFIVQTGLGHGAGTFGAMSVDVRHRPSRFEQGLDVMRRLWNGETVTLDGRWDIRDAVISPRPAEPIEVWIGASADVAIERAARLGEGWLASPGATPQEAHRQVQVYSEERARTSARGSQSSAPNGYRAIRRDIFVGATAEEAATVGERYVKAGYRGIDPAALIYGNAEQVAAAFQELAALGFDEVIVRNMASRQDLAIGTIERLAEVRQLVNR